MFRYKSLALLLLVFTSSTLTHGSEITFYNEDNSQYIKPSEFKIKHDDLTHLENDEFDKAWNNSKMKEVRTEVFFVGWIFIILLASLSCFASNFDTKKNMREIKQIEHDIEDMEQDADKHELETIFDEKLNINWFENPCRAKDEKLIISRTKRDLEAVTHHITVLEHRIKDVTNRNEIMESKLDNL